MTSELTSVKSNRGRMINDYLLTEYLGVGNYGKVRRAIHTKTNKQYAVKIIKRAKFRSRKTQDDNENTNQKKSGIEQEMNCLIDMDHQNVIKLMEVIDDPLSQKIYLVMELC